MIYFANCYTEQIIFYWPPYEEFMNYIKILEITKINPVVSTLCKPLYLVTQVSELKITVSRKHSDTGNRMFPRTIKIITQYFSN
jgi:hypothetical protein